ncbi:hypothetical protein BDN67DRAFT_974282 [Paxillus ammoniavirescens]|nr:hypothetical protein BDN67DRAFT_974282 [Paxillus ammoniavirescens]
MRLERVYSTDWDAARLALAFTRLACAATTPKDSAPYHKWDRMVDLRGTATTGGAAAVVEVDGDGSDGVHDVSSNG